MFNLANSYRLARVKQQLFAQLDISFSLQCSGVYHTAEELQNLLEDLNRKSTDSGLKNHPGKSKVMFNGHARQGPITIGNVTLESVQ